MEGKLAETVAVYDANAKAMSKYFRSVNGPRVDDIETTVTGSGFVTGTDTSWFEAVLVKR